jgi:zinc protease
VGQASPDDIYNAISGVTLDDVNRVLRTYLDSKHAIIALLTPKNVRTLPRSDSGAVTDTVGVTPSHDEPLPSWALRYFNTALRAPAGDGEVATYRLSNGIRLTVRRETLSPTVYLSGSIRMSPDLYEPAHREGVAQITNTLLLWGTQTFDRKAFQAQFDAVSASGTLGPDFSLQVQSKNFDRALGLIADGLLHPAFPQDGLDVVKNDAARTLAAVEHQPGTQAALARIAALYPKGDPRRRRATPDSVKAISMADVQHWYAFAFRPDETTIAVVGNVAPADVKAAVERYFGAWKANGKRPSFEYPKIKTNKSQSVTVNSASSTQSDVTLTQVIGVHRGDDDYIALELANTILSDEGIGSMLFRDLRERKGYVYDVSSSMDIGRSSSTFSIEFQSDPKNVKAAQSAAVADIRRLQNALVPLDELQRAKALVLARRVLPLDSYEGIADDILDTARSGETRDDDAAFWQELLETTPQQIRAAMRRWINPGHFSRVIIAPDP